MTRQGYDLGDYNDVASRIQEFREKYPTGSLQPADPGRPYFVERFGDKAFVIVVTAAYRTPDDPRPGIGTAWEPVPGLTPYTRGSEIQNAETSSWGRALIAVGAADARKGIASREEVEARRTTSRRQSTQDGVSRETGSQQGESGGTDPIRPQQRAAIQAGFGELGYGGPANRDQRLAVAARLAGLESLGSTNDLTAAQARAVLDGLAERRKAQRQENPSG
jgi:hypothetical protein